MRSHGARYGHTPRGRRDCSATANGYCARRGKPVTGQRYIKPSMGTHLLNAVLAALARAGISVYGSRIIAVRGRTSGEWRTVPVNVLNHDGAQYLVAPRSDTQWVRNLRIANTGELRLGRHAEPFHAEELRDADKPALLRAYLRKWAFEVKAFFDGVGADASDTDLLRIAPNHPVFRIEPAVAAGTDDRRVGQPAATPHAREP